MTVLGMVAALSIRVEVGVKLTTFAQTTIRKTGMKLKIVQRTILANQEAKGVSHFKLMVQQDASNTISVAIIIGKTLTSQRIAQISTYVCQAVMVGRSSTRQAIRVTNHQQTLSLPTLYPQIQQEDLLLQYKRMIISPGSAKSQRPI